MYKIMEYMLQEILRKSSLCIGYLLLSNKLTQSLATQTTES